MIQAYFKKFGFVFKLWDFTFETGWFSGENPCLLTVKVLYYHRDINWFTLIEVNILNFAIGLHIDRFNR